MNTQAELVAHIMRCLPLPNQAQFTCHASEPEAVRFNWRGQRFRVAKLAHKYFVDECVEPGLLGGSNSTLLLERLLQTAPNSPLDTPSRLD